MDCFKAIDNVSYSYANYLGGCAHISDDSRKGGEGLEY